MVDSLECREEEMFESDDVVRGLSQKHEETAPALSCHTCGEEIYSEEFVNDEKLYCSEECMERESSAMSVDTTRRRVSLRHGQNKISRLSLIKCWQAAKKNGCRPWFFSRILFLK